MSEAQKSEVRANGLSMCMSSWTYGCLSPTLKNGSCTFASFRRRRRQSKTNCTHAPINVMPHSPQCGAGWDMDGGFKYITSALEWGI